MQQGRIVVVTGAGGGIGSKIVDRFLKNGDTVVGLDRSAPALKALVEERKTEVDLSVVTSDITHVDQVAAFAKYAIAELVQDWASPAGSELIKLLVPTAPMMQQPAKEKP